jgi:hypothetical protein
MSETKAPKVTLVLENNIIEFYNELENPHKNTNYDLDYSEKNSYKPSTKYGIKVYDNYENILKSCIISGSGGSTLIDEDSMKISGNAIYICCSDNVYSLSIPELKHLWKKQLDDLTCFTIHYLNEDFLVHGETNLTRVDTSGNIKWQFSGEDILLTLEGIDDLKILENKIIVKNFNHREYILDFDGNEISLKK